MKSNLLVAIFYEMLMECLGKIVRIKSLAIIHGYNIILWLMSPAREGDLFLLLFFQKVNKLRCELQLRRERSVLGCFSITALPASVLVLQI